MKITGVNYTVEIDEEEYTFDYDARTGRVYLDKNAHMISIPLEDLKAVIARIEEQTEE